MIKKNKLYFSLLILTLIVVAFIIAWQLIHVQAIAQAQSVKSAVPVQAVTVSEQNEVLVIKAPGTVCAIQNAEVSSQASGIVNAIMFQNGQFVKKGTSLVVLENAEDKAALDSAVAQANLSSKNYFMYKDLYKEGAVSKQAYEQALSAYQMNSANVERLKSQLAYKNVTAPFDGYLGESAVSIGDYIQAGQPIVSIVDKNKIQIDYEISETWANQVKQGQLVMVSSDTEKTDLLKGEVSFIGSIANPQTRGIPIQATVPDPSHFLLPGAFVEVYQYITTGREVFAIPSQSLIVNPEGQFVYKIVQGRAQLTRVGASLEKSSMVDVYSGLLQGDLVITEGQENLSDGSLVTNISQGQVAS